MLLCAFEDPPTSRLLAMATLHYHQVPFKAGEQICSKPWSHQIRSSDLFLSIGCLQGSLFL